MLEMEERTTPSDAAEVLAEVLADGAAVAMTDEMLDDTDIKELAAESAEEIYGIGVESAS